MPVHLYGHPADMAGLVGAWPSGHGLAVVEDAAQAHGASIDGRPVGSFGDAAAFSFYPTKNMTTGEGGMVVLADDGAARTARLLRSQGMERQYENEIVGFNLRMTDIAAAIGRVQLGRLPGFTETRRKQRRDADGRAGRVGDGDPARRARRLPARVPPVHGADRGPDGLLARCEAAGVEARVVLPDARAPAAVVRPRARPPEHGAGDRRGGVAAGRTAPLGLGDLERVIEAVSRERLRMAVIGLGMMGRHHVRLARATEGVELVGVHDPMGDPHGVAGGVPNHATLESSARRRDRRRGRGDANRRSSECREARWRLPACTC